LYLNVIRPANISGKKSLPVIFWIYGGGFASGDSAANPGDSFVTRALANNKPVIFVSANYRLNVFGFLGGKEVQEAGLANLGLHDQQFALKWIQEHISEFGGDPRKVTIWGQSAGATSVSLHLLANEGNTEGLFVGGIMNSGSPYHLTDTASRQQWFDFIAQEVNCASAHDRLQCLRDAPYQLLVNAVNKTPALLDYQSINLVWRPTVDGKFIIRDPVLSIQQEKYAKIPIMTGDTEDEGTLFVLSSLNVTNSAILCTYHHSSFFPHARDSDLKLLAQKYSDNPAEGSPFNTGTDNVKSPESKRLTAVLGDLLFQAPRRFFLRYTSRTQATYGSVPLPGLGIYHGFDLPEFFGVGSTPDFEGTDSINSKLCSILWPKWSSSSPQLLTFVDADPGLNITADTYRQDAMDVINRLWLNEVFSTQQAI
ncbi:Alpha/Beta hydrolase protein, partial [Crepidotus variabilis]